MDEEGFGWHLPGVANDDSMIHNFQGTRRPPQNPADANVTAISCQGLTNFYATIY
jgi:hypothetical protein